MEMVGIRYSGYRTIPKPNSCENCDFITHTMEQGVAGCKKVSGVYTECTETEWTVCDYWIPKYVPTEKELILKKLTKREREVLGIN